MKITNIANSREKQGYFYSSEHYHPTTNHLQVEPWIAGCWLRLDEEITVPDHTYWAEKDLMDALKANHIIDFQVPKREEIQVVVQIPAQEKITEKVIQLDEAEKFHKDFKETISTLKEAGKELEASLIQVIETEVSLEAVKEEQKVEIKKSTVKPYNFQKAKK